MQIRTWPEKGQNEDFGVGTSNSFLNLCSQNENEQLFLL